MKRCLLDKERMGGREKEVILIEEIAYAKKRAKDRRSKNAISRKVILEEAGRSQGLKPGCPTKQRHWFYPQTLSLW